MRKIWFTLIELLIAVSISALIMTSVMIFTWDMIRNSIKSQKRLVEQNNNSLSELKIQDTLNNISWNSIFFSWSSFWYYKTWIILKTNWNSSPLVYIWLKTFTWYCNNAWSQTNATWTINKLVIKEMVGETSHLNSANYYIDTNKNSIYSAWWNLIIWTWIKWSDYSQNPLKTELSNPSAIYETADYLYISDNGNNRILSYDKASHLIEIIADNLDWINNPTDLFYQAWTLYITNAWNNNILTIKDSYWNWTIANITFKIGSWAITFDKIELKFNWIPNISSPNTIWNFSFNWINSSVNDDVSVWTSLIYSFSWINNTITGGTININNINPKPAWVWSYWVNINFYSWGILSKTLNELYYIKWDNNVGTRVWNIIDILTWWLVYPNNITSANNWDTNITNWTWILNNIWNNEYISEFPIKDFSFWLKNNFLNIKYTYYKTYDCINEKHLIKERNYIKYLH